MFLFIFYSVGVEETIPALPPPPNKHPTTFSPPAPIFPSPPYLTHPYPIPPTKYKQTSVQHHNSNPAIISNQMTKLPLRPFQRRTCAQLSTEGSFVFSFSLCVSDSVFRCLYEGGNAQIFVFEKRGLGEIVSIGLISIGLML